MRSVLYLHRGRQERAAEYQRRNLLIAVEGVQRALREFSQALQAGQAGAVGEFVGRVAVVNAIPVARQFLADGRSVVQDYLAHEAPDATRREEFEGYQRDLATLEARLAKLVELGSGKGGAGAAQEKALPYLLDDVRKLANGLDSGSRTSAEDLLWVGKRALTDALVLGGLG